MTKQSSYQEKELRCELFLNQLGKLYHACTPENHPIIFSSIEDYSQAMDIMGICAKMCPSISIVTFELMSNHLHILASGEEESIFSFFDSFKKYLERYLKESGRHSNLVEFTLKTIPVNGLENIRNVIAYINRNAAVVLNDVTPMSYPWGANRFFFMEEVKKRHVEQMKPLRAHASREITHSRKCDDVKGLFIVDDHISPICFCDIAAGERLFRDARQYFHKISRHVEAYDDISRSIGENIIYSDDDLFSSAVSIASKEFGYCGRLNELPQEAKIKLAKRLHYDYNAGNKQIMRMLKLSEAVVSALFGK